MDFQKVGAEIFEKFINSSFATMKDVRRWLRHAERKAANEIRTGFYQAENAWAVAHPDYMDKVIKRGNK